MIYNGLRAVAEAYDIFIFDAYGVFWEGNGFYAGSREVMADLVRSGKTVVVVSNSSALSSDLIASYDKRGLKQGVHYQYLMSSGDLLKQRLQSGQISFSSSPNPQKYYVIGKPHSKAFANTKYVQVPTLDEADFVYIGVPYMFAADVAQYPQYMSEYWPVAQDENGQITLWDTLTPAPFEQIVDEAVRRKLPALNANPDWTAKEGHPLVANSGAVFVVRNGMIAEMLRQKGSEVLEFGKPHRNIYDYVFEILHQNGITVEKNKTCMIGDTVRTDIKGGINAGIAPILCVETGVTAEAISGGQTVESLCAKENIDIKQVIQIKSVGGI